jgi:methionyl-tRNA formyltransferase
MPSGSPLRIIFAGTPAFAAVHLRGLLDSGLDICAVYTQPDRPAGRGKKLAASPVKELALQAGLPVYQPTSLRDPTAQRELASLQADVLVVVAYGLILPQAVLDIPRLGCINVHASLLPRWRGAAPIQRAIEAGDAQTGITIMQMDAGLDTGPMLATTTVAIGSGMTAGSLHDKLAERGVPLLLEVLADLEKHLQSAKIQPERGVTYAHKIEKAEAEIAWSQDATTLTRRILAFNPFPVAWTSVDGQRLKVWLAEEAPGAGGPAGVVLPSPDSELLVACGTGALRITALQLPGGRMMTAAELLLSRRQLFAPGTQLGSA